MNETSASILAPLMPMSSTRRYLDYANAVLRIDNGALLHAGGTAYKGKVSVSVDASIESTGTDAGATVAASDDDDGDGDGDPDSDRRKLSKKSASKSATFAHAIQLPQTGFVRLPKVLSTIPVSKSTWWAGIKSGKYPAGIKLSERVTAWRVEDIHALINQLTSNAS
nr:AlpA family phage regulatory protein [uncultured Undibacterium sp.]